MFREMSETELIIRSIENVRMISIYELMGIGDRPEKGCAAISIFYGKDKHINLCELDEGFDILAEKIFEIYGDLEDKSEVHMDDRTQRVLESGFLNSDEDFLEKYYSMQPAELPGVAFESATVRKILPMVEYLLDAVYKVLGIKYEVTAGKAGWRGAGVIYGMLNGSRVVSGINAVQNTETEYEIIVNNFVTPGNVLRIIMTVGNASVVLSYSCEYSDIHGTGIYAFDEEGYSEFHETFRDGKKVFRDSREVRRSEPIALTEDEKGLIPWDYDENSIIGLPWGMLFVGSQKATVINNCTVDEARSCYIYRDAGYSENRCWIKVKNDNTKFSLTTTSVVMHIMNLTRGERQVYFLPHVGNHKQKYRQQLEGRYFVIGQ